MVQQHQANKQQQDQQDPAANCVFKSGDLIIVATGDYYPGRKGSFKRDTANGNCTVQLFPEGDHPPKRIELPADRLAHYTQPVEVFEEGTHRIPLNLIILDPNQPRKTYRVIPMEELAASIVTHDLLQAVTVRPTGDGRYMLVLGERRFRASCMVEALYPDRNTILANVRPMSDDEAIEVQIIENLQREDVHEMEESVAFNVMHKRLTIDEIAERVGKGRKYIVVRLRLIKLIDEFQEMYLAGKMNFEDAKRLSMATPETQQLVFKSKTEKINDWRNDDWVLTNYKWMLDKEDQDLSKAEFDITDPELYPEMGACATCPHNSAYNQLFGDQEGSICNFAACFNIKAERLYQTRLKAAASNPNVLAIAEHVHDSAGIAKVAAAESMGLSVIKEDDWEEITPKPVPEFETFRAKLMEIDDLSEEVVRERFDEAVSEWEEGQASYEQAVDQGRVKEAFVVSGSGAGTFKPVMLAEKVVEKTATDVSAKIQQLIQAEDIAKETDASIVFVKVAESLKSEDTFINNDKALKKSETIGLAILLMANANSDAKSWLAEQLGFSPAANDPFPSRIQLLDKMATDLTAEMMNEFIRKTLAERLITANDSNPIRSAAPKAILGIAQEYIPGYVKSITAQQNEIADQRSWKVQEQINELKHSAITGKGKDLSNTLVVEEALPLRTENTRMIIKVCPPNSNSGWKKLEGPFATVAEMETRYQELINTGMYYNKEARINE